ncbi:TraB/GumN family protein [Hellea balneolensis]|uniref:TraB/GumN family protein n=1 Tax=Hellea balneolensis TaxID=287478 RepID=UPI000414B5CA|nr:TraB/GumN family protein [Hellea balneolensis]
MLKYLLPLIATLLVACGDTPVISGVDDKVNAARDRNDGPAIWTVKDFNSTLYLYGTVHLLPTDLDWQKEDMRSAFNEAGTIFFEVDTGPDGQVQAAVLTTSLGMRQDGLRLSDSLDSYQLKLLDAAAHNGEISLAALDSMKPWLASEFLTVAAATNAGLSPELSADDALKSRARREQKNIIYLETIEDQIRVSADQAKSIQLSLLTETLEGFNSLGDDLMNVAKAWAVGSTDYLTREMVAPLKSKSPIFYDALITQRNRKWIVEFVKFMEGSGTGFAAVGTSHLLGEDSVIEMLREQGYEVSRYYAFQGEDVINPINPTIERPETE